MAVKPVVTYPNPILKEKSEPVEAVTDEIRALIEDMKDTMYAEAGVGLAAIQVGAPLRLCTMDITGPEERAAPRVFINPEIVDAAGSATFDEGCLSIPGYKAEFARPERVLIKALDENGQEILEWLDGVAARAIQHEIDHMDGVLFLDHLSRLKRGLIARKIEKQLVHAGAEFL